MAYGLPSGVQRLDSLLTETLRFSARQTDILKVLALLMMLADHINRSFELDIGGLQWLGRGAFPLFGLVWCRNLARHTAITQRQVNRLWGWAVLAQPGYTLALHFDNRLLACLQANILFAFAVAGQIFLWVQARREVNYVKIVLLLMVWAIVSLTSYDFSGLVMLGGAYLAYIGRTPTRRLAGLGLWCLMSAMMNHGDDRTMMFAAPLLATACLCAVMPLRYGAQAEQRLLVRHFIPLAYIGHLVVLAALTWGL